MAPLCGQHRAVPGTQVDSHHGPGEDSMCRWSSPALNKRSNLWPKNTSTYHRPRLSSRGDLFNEHTYRSDVDNSDHSDSGDNTTIVIGSVVGVALLVVAFGIITCCCLASRRAKKCRRKKKKMKDKCNSCCKGKEKGKDKKDKKDKNDKKDKDKKPPYTGRTEGTYQQVLDRLNHDYDNYIGDQLPPGIQPPHLGSFGGFGVHGGQMGPGNEMDAPQNNYM